MIMESTYGNRHHKKHVDHVPELAQIIQETEHKKPATGGQE